MPAFVIAEAGVNHNGDPARAHAMIDVAARAGADAVKFQTFTAERVISRSAKKAEYQLRETGGGSQLDMVKPLELSDEAHRELAAHCVAAGIEFMSTAFDDDALDLLLSLGVKRLKVASGELTNFQAIERMAKLDLPLIVSTGMATIAEVEEAVNAIAEARRSVNLTGPLGESVTLLHCTSNYPADPADVNLRAMQTMASVFGLPVGYSDHTLGTTVSVAAVAMGATVIEKHFTMDRSLPGPDHRASLDPEELAELVSRIRTLESALGNGVKEPSQAELAVRDVARRSVAARHALTPGHVLTEDDLEVLRPGTGIEPKSLKSLVGRVVAQPVEEGVLLAWEDLV